MLRRAPGDIEREPVAELGRVLHAGFPHCGRRQFGAWRLGQLGGAFSSRPRTSRRSPGHATIPFAIRHYFALRCRAAANTPAWPRNLSLLRRGGTGTGSAEPANENPDALTAQDREPAALRCPRFGGGRCRGACARRGGDQVDHGRSAKRAAEADGGRRRGGAQAVREDRRDRRSMSDINGRSSISSWPTSSARSASNY